MDHAHAQQYHNNAEIQQSWQQYESVLPTMAPVTHHPNPQHPFNFGADSFAAQSLRSDMQSNEPLVSATRLLPSQNEPFIYAPQALGRQMGGATRTVNEAHGAGYVDGMNIIGEGSRNGLWRSFVGSLVDHQSAVQPLDHFTG